MAQRSEHQTVMALLRTPTTRDILVNKLYATRRDHAVYEFCEMGTKHLCRQKRGHHLGHCNKIHFVRIMRPHTMPTLGDCSYLDGCRHMDTCRFVHYIVDEGCVA